MLVFPNSDDDQENGGSGIDKIEGNGGSDVLTGSSGNDVIYHWTMNTSIDGDTAAADPHGKI